MLEPAVACQLSVSNAPDQPFGLDLGGAGKSGTHLPYF